MGAEKGVSAFPEGENFFKWVGTISGPVGTVSVLRNKFVAMMKYF